MSATPRRDLHVVGEEPVKKLTLVQAVADALATEMRRDPTVLVMGEDVGRNGGVFRATEGLYDEFGPDRVMDTPLSESGIVGTAIGLAMTGWRPVAEIQFMGFVYPAINQLLAHAARMRNRTRGRFSVPMVVRMPYGGGIHAPEHHSESYEALFVHTPGIKVVVPSTPHDAKGLLIAAIRDPDPVLFMEPKRIYRAFRGEVPAGDYTVPIGTARLVREGDDVTLIAWGAMVPVAEDAARELEREGVGCEVLDLRTLNPLDIEAIEGSVRKTGRAVVVHEAPRQAGLGAEISALLMERCILDLEAPVQRVAGFDTVMPLARMEKLYLPHRDRVVRAVRRTLEF
ncbi:MAG: alpha-ketoacid dehydrogenase subunit beta [Nitrospirae bacterium]|nr:MAG: alpha-ketoacid dehydrogenase subunit beta [Nitrospirota bacterium]